MYLQICILHKSLRHIPTYLQIGTSRKKNPPRPFALYVFLLSRCVNNLCARLPVLPPRPRSIIGKNLSVKISKEIKHGRNVQYLRMSRV